MPRILGGMDMDNLWVAIFWGLLPSIVVLSLFVFILRGIIRFDRTERRVYARVEAEEREKRGLPPLGAKAGPTASEQ